MENQAYISHVHLKGYKSIKDMEIDLKPGLNVIIGPNGSGKTNFLEGLLYQALAPKFKEKSFASIDINDTQNNTYSWSLQVDKVNHDDFDFLGQSTIGKGFVYKNNNLVKEFDEPHSSYTFLRESLNGDFFRIFNPIKVGFDNLVNFSLLDKAVGLTINFKKKDIAGQIWLRPFEKNIFTEFDFIKNTFNNFNTSDFIAEMKFKHGLVENLIRYTPIKNIRLKEPFVFNKMSKNETINIDFLLLEFQINDGWFTWNKLSDGTKRIFIIVAQTTNWKGLMLIEEPELGIHPDQLHLLMDFLKEQSKEKQIIITTHSPEVLNILGKDELDRIIITRYDAEKGTQMHHLSPKQIRKGQIYIEETGDLKSFWVHSNLEEYETE